MIFEMLSSLPENTVNELRERHPEKNHINMVAAMTDIAIDMLRESPEFRRAYARIHVEPATVPIPETGTSRQSPFQAESVC